MSQLQPLIKKLMAHRLAIIIAIMVGVISIAPQLAAVRDQNYKGIQMFGTDAEYDYVAKMNQAQYDDYSKGIFPTEPGKNYYLAPELTERSMGFLARIFHLRVIEVNIIFKFMGSVILFFILYGWLLEMFSIKSVAVVAPLFVILGINLLDPHEIVRLLSLKTHIDSFLPYTRPVSPQISSIFLFCGLWGIYHFIHAGGRLRSALLLGIVSGLSLYVYIYTWTLLVVVTGLCLAYFGVRKEFIKVKYFLVVIGVNFLLASSFFLNLLKARGDLDYINTSARIGLIHSHAPIFGASLILGVLIIIFLWPSYRPGTKYMFLCMFGAVALLLNQQIITGLKLQPGHYHWYTTKPLLAIILVFLVLYWSEKFILNRSVRLAIPILLGGVFFINAAILQAHSYSANYSNFQSNQQYSGLLNFIGQNYPQRATVWAEPKLSTLILAYTHHRSPNNAHAQYYLDSQAHLKDILILEYRLKGILGKDIRAMLDTDREYITSKLHGIYYRDLPGNQQISDTELEDLSLQYSKSLALPLIEIFNKLNIDLVVEGASQNSVLGKDLYLSKTLIDGFYVYQLDNN